jgi:predicted O-methyltransferase YrrM
MTAASSPGQDSLGAIEPKNPDEVRSWIAENLWRRDRFRHVFEQSLEHRAEHDCDTYPSSNARTIGLLTAVASARSVLEIGCGLGYSSLWIAYAAPNAAVITVERDPDHVRLAEQNFQQEDLADRITILDGDESQVLDQIKDPFDVVFYDAGVPNLALLDRMMGLVDEGGVLITSNLFLAQYVPEFPGLEEAAHYREMLLDREDSFTSFVGELAVTVVR